MIAQYDPRLWFTADPHFGHHNILQYSHRPFQSMPQMDGEITRRWNSVVGPDDTVYVIGDFTLNGPSDAAIYFSRLNGNIGVLAGDHDHRWLASDQYRSRTNYVVRILPQLVTLDFDERLIGRRLSISLLHYAMRVWPKSHYGAYQLYGHSHGTLPGIGRQMDVGVDANDFTPVSLVNVIELLEPKQNAGELERHHQSVRPAAV